MSRFEQVAAVVLTGAFGLAFAGICLAGGGPARIADYALGELSRIGQAFAGKESFVAVGDPTLPGYFLLLSFTGLLLAMHAVARITGRGGAMPGRSLWRWSAVHAIVSMMWLLCVLWPQIALVGFSIVHPAWGLALLAFAVEFAVSATTLLVLPRR